LEDLTPSLYHISGFLSLLFGTIVDICRFVVQEDNLSSLFVFCRKNGESQGFMC
jgi:hypothetical protein